MATIIYADIPLASLDLNPLASGYLTGDARTQQAITILLQTGLGEYINDLTWGLDFAGWAQGPDTVAISVRLRSLIAAEPGVRSVDSCTVTQDGVDLNISIGVTFTSGTVMTATGTTPGIAPAGNGWVWTLVRGWT